MELVLNLKLIFAATDETNGLTFSSTTHDYQKLVNDIGHSSEDWYSRCKTGEYLHNRYFNLPCCQKLTCMFVQIVKCTKLSSPGYSVTEIYDMISVIVNC